MHLITLYRTGPHAENELVSKIHFEPLEWTPFWLVRHVDAVHSLFKINSERKKILKGSYDVFDYFPHFCSWYVLNIVKDAKLEQNGINVSV